MDAEPTTLKGLSKLDMQAKIKEKQEAAKPTQVAAKPTHTATPIISNQAEFDTWFQSMMSAGPGNLKVVNPMIAPIDD